MVGEAYQVMLTIRGRLITPFALGSMPVGLNILIRHSFTDLWDWFMGWVPWPQLHATPNTNICSVCLFVCVEVLRPSQPNGVMSSAVSLPNHTFTGQAESSKRLTSIVHILSPETDNCPSWISGRGRMTVENISWSISTKECCRPRRGLNPRPPGLQSDGASNWATEAGKYMFGTNKESLPHLWNIRVKHIYDEQSKELSIEPNSVLKP